MTDSAYLGSESTYSECETFTDEDTGALLQPEMHEEVETDSGIEATLHDAEDSGNRSVSSPCPWTTGHVLYNHVHAYIYTDTLAHRANACPEAI